MILYPLICNFCSYRYEDFVYYDGGFRHFCPSCGNVMHIDWSNMKTNVRIFKPIKYDVFPDTFNNPIEVTSERQLKEEFKKREEQGIVPLGE